LLFINFKGKYFILKMKIRYIFLYLSILFSLININSAVNCPRNNPILKSDQCQLIYCTQEEYLSQKCIISNEFTKIQWLNKFHIFNENNMYHISVSENDKGELFLSSQKVSDDYDKYLFAFSSDGEGLLYDKQKEKYTSFEIIDFPRREYADYNKYVEFDGKGYLMGVPTDDDIYLIDYMNNTIKDYNIYPISQSSDTIFQMKNLVNTYFTAYMFCKDQFTKNCFIHFQSFQLNSTHLIKINNITNVPADVNTRIDCNQNDKNFIFCFYTKKKLVKEQDYYDNIYSYEHYLSLINPNTLNLDDTILIDGNFDKERMFDETINLKDNLYILAYSIEDEVIKVLFKDINVDENNKIKYEDHFKNIKEVFINKDISFKLKEGHFRKNDLCKINNNKFTILLKDYTKKNSNPNSVLLIYIFTIFNNDKNINVRRYSIDFELYNKNIADDVRGYNLGNFFGIVLGLTKDMTSPKSISTFMTFGYVNSTEQENIDIKFLKNDTNSKIVLSDYINEVENNLFGYKFLGIKIISIPDEKDSGYFIDKKTNKKIIKDDLISREDNELKFILSDTYKKGIYSIAFAGALQEPSYQEMNQFSEELVSYPEGDNTSEESFYNPKILIGKKMNYKFRLSECYYTCDTCSEQSGNEKDHKCITCKNGFYFIEGTNNCYDKIDTKYYFDDEQQVFLPCYRSCLTCSTKQDDIFHQNCLSCENGFKFYNKSNNCLSCSNFTNFEQTMCINEIPNGYYLEDKELGILGECHELCYNCTNGPSIKDTVLHMNCNSCKYNNSHFVPEIEGNCPQITEPDYPVDGKCPYIKPILKNNLCTISYCTEKEFQDKTCQIYHPIIKTQWLNNFHIFSELNNSLISIETDINPNIKTIFFSQNIDESNDKKEKYLFGFYGHGAGIFTDETENFFEIYKKISFPKNSKYFDKIAYIEINFQGYLLTTPIGKYFYLIDYENDKIKTNELDIPSYTADKIIILKVPEDSVTHDFAISYIYCNDIIKKENCYLMIKMFGIENEKIYEKYSMKKLVEVYYDTELNCIRDEQNFIKCTYSKYGKGNKLNHVLSIFSSDKFELKKEYILEDSFDPEPTFDSMIQFNKTISVFAYSIKDKKNIIQVVLKKVEYDYKIRSFYIDNLIIGINSILINEDNLYKFIGAKASSNSLVKISYDKFALFVNDFTIYNSNNLNSRIIIFIFTLYNSNTKINVRHYPINLNIYNRYIDKKIIGYNLNGFTGMLIESTSPENDQLKRASFLTFGYMNSTKDINSIEGNNILFEKKEKIKLNSYFNEIENNLFGYELSGIKVISVPDPTKVGYFSTIFNNQIKSGDILKLNSELTFHKIENSKNGNYSIIFAPVLKEPENYDKMNSYCQKIESYPKKEVGTESQFYQAKTIIGKYFSFHFSLYRDLNCFFNCEKNKCYDESLYDNNQQCIECKNGYYKMNGTNNCYSSYPKFYLDKEKKLLFPCYTNCSTCDNSGNSTSMNCLSCDNNKHNFYNKSKNCLKCPLYIDYFQIKCIDEIPEGYYLDDKVLGTIEKCHDLCKNCTKKPIVENGTVYMNCNSCKFKNVNFKNNITGNCPDSENDQIDDGGKDNDTDTDNSRINENNESKNYFIWIISAIAVLFIIIVIIVVYIKYFNKNKFAGNEYDYLNTQKGKVISLVDEDDSSNQIN